MIGSIKQLDIPRNILIKEPLFGQLKNMTESENYQRIIMINGFHEKVSADLENFNKATRAHKKNLGYYYNKKDGNIYVKISARNGAGGGMVGVQLLVDYSSSVIKKEFNEAAKNENWLALYQHTKFLINQGNESTWFSFQFLPYEKKYLQKRFVIITAFNPYMNNKKRTPKENLMENDSLSLMLEEEKYHFLSSEGELSGYFEDSFIVYDITLEKALEFGRVFQQESIVYNNGQVVAVVDCTTALNVIQVNHYKIYDSFLKSI